MRLFLWFVGEGRQVDVEVVGEGGHQDVDLVVGEGSGERGGRRELIEKVCGRSGGAWGPTLARGVRWGRGGVV